MKYSFYVIFIFLLAGCGSISYHPQSGLSEVSVQSLKETKDCSGKGLYMHSVGNGSRIFETDKNKIYLSPGTWKFKYYPEYQITESQGCSTKLGFKFHDHFELDAVIEKDKRYTIYLNSKNIAEIREN